MLGVSALAAGAAIGLSIAAPVGPMAILCINRTLNSGIRAGISTGAGASTVHVAYTSFVLLGIQHAAPFLESSRSMLGVASAALMLFFAWRILRRRMSPNRRQDAGSMIRNYASAVAFNCLNPMLPVLLVGAIGAVIGLERQTGPAGTMLLLGVFMGSVGWWIALALAAAVLRGRLEGGVLRGINRLAAAGMACFAMFSLARALGA